MGNHRRWQFGIRCEQGAEAFSSAFPLRFSSQKLEFTVMASRELASAFEGRRRKAASDANNPI